MHLTPLALVLATLLSASLASPAPCEEYCTDPPAPSPGDHACAGDLAEGFGGLVTFEREPMPKGPLAAQAQWLDEKFKPVGPMITLDQAASGPMWRPQAVLLDPDTAFAIWSDGRNQQAPVGQPGEYFGFDLKGAILRRGEAKPVATFLLHQGSKTSGYLDATLTYDPLGKRALVTAWGSGDAKDPFLSVYGADELRQAAREHRPPSPTFRVPGMGFGFVALDHDGKLLHLKNDGWNIVRIDRLAPDSAAVLGSRTIDFKSPLEKMPLQPGDDFRWFGHGGIAVGPSGQIAFVREAIARAERPLGYVFALLSPDFKVLQSGYYRGPMPTEINQPRPLVAFSGEEPVLFLPIREKADSPRVSLFVSALVADELTLKDGASFPLPGDLDQFSIVLADDGATGKAAIVATSGKAPVRLCVWPSELIGFKQPAAEDTKVKP